VSWIFGYRRLTIRYERKATYFAAFLSLAATLTCYKATSESLHMRHRLSRLLKVGTGRVLGRSTAIRSGTRLDPRGPGRAFIDQAKGCGDVAYALRGTGALGYPTSVRAASRNASRLPSK
jgi:hypothetical protein